jgi:L-aspartate oxidase
VTKARTALVIGSGVAGLVAAVRASTTHQVTLITKTALGEGASIYAQGGVAAALFNDDSARIHADDTLRIGGGLNSRRTVDILCTEGPARVRDLIDLGVAFDRDGGELARGLEAAHSRDRIVHAGGDRTGAEIQAALVAAARKSRVQILEHVFVEELIIDGNRVVGAVLMHPNGIVESLEADAVVLATGGGGQLYPHTSNPAVSTGDGVALALRAGAALRDLEFFQFHPTTLAMPGNFLISEAVRGEGAVLVDSSGHRFMTDEHPDAELAPRDIVARGIARRAAEQSGAAVLLDATALGAAFLKRRFPGITAATAHLGLDWLSDPIPVTPAAHYWMGGVRTDEWGRTSIPGLFAVGEVACTGVHGANRLASNSLLEALVFGWRCVDALAEPWPEDAEPAPGAIAVEPQVDPSEPVDRASLQSLMWRTAGLFRDEKSLTEAATQLARWYVVVPPASAASAAAIAAAETRNLLDLARVMVASARMRRESRGAHFRSDFPHADPTFARHVDLARKAVITC